MLAKGVKYTDLSHTIEDGLVTYRGLPAPLICDFLSREEATKRYAGGETFQIDKIEMVGNSGTYLDSPFHRYADGKDISELPLERIANLDCLVVRSPANDLNHGIALRALEGLDVAGKAVLLHTGWDRHWNTDAYFKGNSFLETGAAQFLVDQGAALVGIDSLNIDDTRTTARPIHSLLLGHEIPIVEHLTNLRLAPDAGGKFFAVPPKLKAVGTFSVRAFIMTTS